VAARPGLRTAVGWIATLLALTALGLAVWLALWWVPDHLVSSRVNDFAAKDDSGLKGRTDAVNAARTPVAGLFLAIVGALTAWAAHRNVQQSRAALDATRIQHQQKLDADRAAAERTAALTQAGQYTDRYIKAIQLISDDQLNARLGGLYALEQLAKEAPATYHATIVDVLAAYIRDRAPWPPAAPTALDRPSRRLDANNGVAGRTVPMEETLPRPAIDIQAALTILGRRTTRHGQRQLPRENGRVDLTDSDLRGVTLQELHLDGADLSGAHLERADMRHAYLQGADLSGVYLEGANLSQAQLQGAYLPGAHLERVNLRGANLERANLRGADLKGADLVWASFGGADLSKVEGLTWVQVEATHGSTQTMPPDGLRGPKGELRPESWTGPEDEVPW